MEDHDIQTQLSARFQALPERVRSAITSSDVEGHLRALAETHKLHVDQWALLENEVMLTLLGLEQTADLAKNLAREVGMHEDAAEALAADVSKTIFEPIRAELEKVMPAPIGVPEAEGAVEIRKIEVPQEVPLAPTPAPQPILAATPPRTAPVARAERAPISNSYGTSTPSHERATIAGDPYREQVA